MTPPTPPPHRSLADWGSSVRCLLDPTHFISPPTALANQNGTQCWAFRETPDAFNIPYGRVTVSIYAVPTTPTWSTRTELAFRCDSFPTYPLANRYYYLQIWHAPAPYPDPNQIRLYRYEAGSTLLATWNFAPPLNAWTTYRLSWLPGCTTQGLPTFTIRIQRFQAGAWTTIGQYSDPLNKWADQPDNQVALSLFDDQHWLDDFTLVELS